MKRESIMTTYRNLMAIQASFNTARVIQTEQPCVLCGDALIGGVSEVIIDCVENRGTKEAYLLNNRLLFGFIKKGNEHKAQYNRNWLYIESYRLGAAPDHNGSGLK